MGQRLKRSVIMQIDNRLKFLIVLAVLSAAWFSYGYGQVNPWIGDNPILSFFVIWLVFDAILMMYVFKLNPLKYMKVFAAFFIVGIALDILIPPYLVSQAGLVSSDPTIITSDAVFYQMWQMTGLVASPVIGYYLTMVLTPVLLIALAGIMLGEDEFFEQIKQQL